MKTDKFEKTIRRKLESISPDFQESDWTKMQSYMQVHTPPSFWQQYGSWIGYAAAASVTSVMAFMYVQQISQNDLLRNDLKGLQSQIKVIQNQPLTIPKTDTIYVIQKESITQAPDYRNFNRQSETLAEREETERVVPLTGEAQTELHANSSNIKRTVQDESTVPNTSDLRDAAPERLVLTKTEETSGSSTEKNTTKNIDQPEKAVAINKSANQDNGNNPTYKFKTEGSIPERAVATEINSNINEQQLPNFSGRALGSRFDRLAELTPVQISDADQKMNGMLANRLSAKQIRKTWMATTAANYNAAESAKKTQQLAKTEQVTKAENVIPRLNIRAPYRFGVGIQSEKYAFGKTITGEVLVSKKFSISTGLTWLKVKPVEFITEKVFRDRSHRDFKEQHPNEVPRAFPVLNIRVDPSIVQIPLTVAFRNDLKDNWAFFAGAGTNVVVKSKEKISYDCIVPNPYNEFQSNSFERKMDVPVINSLNFSAGLEKTFHPIVIQAEAYLYTYFKPVTPLNQRTGPGFKVKLLYQIGRKM
jgi:hypothetical protein